MNNFEFMLDTINYYTSNPRAIGEDEVCRYETEYGERCAIGRYMTREELDTIKQSGRNGQSLFLIGTVPERIADVQFGLLNDVQRWHDCSEYWNSDDELDELGYIRLEQIITENFTGDERQQLMEAL